MSQTKPRVIKDFEKLDPSIQEQIKLSYPYGFSTHLIKFTNKEGKRVSALPFETEEKYYLVRMTVNDAISLIEEDEDYDDEGNLRDSVRENYEEKYPDFDELEPGDEDVD